MTMEKEQVGHRIIDGATDCHVHVFGPQSRYSYADHRHYTPPDALPAACRAMLDNLGISRVVLVQPIVYGLDNRRHLDATQSIGLPARVIAIIAASTSDRELGRLHDQGVRGVRLTTGQSAIVPFDELERIGDKIRSMGWHIDLMLKPGDLADLEQRLAALTCPFVLDHFGMPNVAEGLNQRAFAALLRLLRSGKCWVKISSAYRLSRQAPPYSDLDPYIAALMATRADRLVWGSDWPHPNTDPPPETSELLASFFRVVRERHLQEQILRKNPEALYDFG